MLKKLMIGVVATVIAATGFAAPAQAGDWVPILPLGGGVIGI